MIVQQLRTWRDALLAAIAKLTQRERALAAVLAVLAALWAAASAFGAVEEAQLRVMDARAQAAPQRTTALATDVRNAQAWSIGNDSVALAQVRALALVERAANRAGVDDVTTYVEAPEPARGARIVVLLDGAYDTTTFGELLAALGETDESLTPLAIEVDRTRQRLRMRIAAVHLPKSAP